MEIGWVDKQLQSNLKICNIQDARNRQYCLFCSVLKLSCDIQIFMRNIKQSLNWKTPLKNEQNCSQHKTITSITTTYTSLEQNNCQNNFHIWWIIFNAKYKLHPSVSHFALGTNYDPSLIGTLSSKELWSDCSRSSLLLCPGSVIKQVNVG